MSIRPMAFCVGLALTPGFAATAHATYDVTVLAGPGRVGPAMRPPPPGRLEATPK